MFLYQSEVWLDAPLAAVFDFFANAAKLGEITPPFLDFEVLTPQPIDMHAGTLIDYRLRVRGIPLRWQSEITAWEPPHHFTDVQRRGPYRLWRHHHDFCEREAARWRRITSSTMCAEAPSSTLSSSSATSSASLRTAPKSSTGASAARRSRSPEIRLP
jgi:ligand-binding SRPBCC domain-containing protein